MTRCTAEGVVSRRDLGGDYATRDVFDLPPARCTVFSPSGARRAAVGVIAAAALLLAGCAPGAVSPHATPLPAPSSPTAEPAPAAPSTPAPSPSSSPDPVPPITEPPTQETAPPAPPPPPALLELSDEGDAVRDLQHRLLQLDWFSGKITGVYTEDTRLAIEGFQAKRGIPVTGAVDQVTLDRLHAMTREPTRDEMYNVLTPGPAIYAQGSQGDGVKDVQARLKQIGWYSPKIDGVFGAQTVESVKGFQAKRQIPVTGEVDQRTKDRLYGMTRKPTADELNNVVRAATPSTMTLDDRCLTGRVICISKGQRRLAWVVDGTIVDTMSVRFGSELTPTRNGVFSVYWKSKNHVSSLYDTPMPYALFFSGGQAVHYSADFARNGYNGASHGCVNVRDKSAVAALFDAARVGDKVVVYA